MSVNNFMKFKLFTLVDITETRARREQDPLGWRQQQNFNTVFGALSLRVNTLYDQSPLYKKIKIDKLGFGSFYKGQQNVWEFEFYIEYDEGLSVNNLEEDFDLIPFLSGLNETAKVEQNIFRTKDSILKNIIFEQIDK